MVEIAEEIEKSDFTQIFSQFLPTFNSRQRIHFQECLKRESIKVTLIKIKLRNPRNSHSDSP